MDSRDFVGSFRRNDPVTLTVNKLTLQGPFGSICQEKHCSKVFLYSNIYIFALKIEKKLEKRSLITNTSNKLIHFIFVFDYFRFFIALLISLAKSGNYCPLSVE